MTLLATIFRFGGGGGRLHGTNTRVATVERILPNFL